MKFKAFEQQHDYEFVFIFENGEKKCSDIKELVEQYLKPDELQIATINDECGYLEFKDGASLGLLPGEHPTLRESKKAIKIVEKYYPYSFSILMNK